MVHQLILYMSRRPALGDLCLGDTRPCLRDLCLRETNLGDLCLEYLCMGDKLARPMSEDLSLGDLCKYVPYRELVAK